MPPPMKPDKIPRPAHIRLFGATRVAPEPQLLPKHFRQHARRLRWRVLRGCWQRFGRCGFRRHGCFRGKYELAPVNKAINLKSQYEIAANSTSVLRLTLTVRRRERGELPERFLTANTRESTRICFRVFGVFGGYISSAGARDFENMNTSPNQ